MGGVYFGQDSNGEFYLWDDALIGLDIGFDGRLVVLALGAEATEVRDELKRV